MAEEAEDHVFTYTWSIHHFSHLPLKPGDELESPKFEVGFLVDDEFCLKLCPTGGCEYPADSISCRVCRDNRYSDVPFRFSILKPNGLFEEKNILHILAQNRFREGFQNVRNLKEISIKPDSYLDNDTLTIRCQLWEKKARHPVSVLCMAHTKIKVSKLLYTWTLDDIDLKCTNETYLCEITRIPSFSLKIPKLEMRLMYDKDTSFVDDNMIYLEIQTSTVNIKFLLVYDIHLLNADGSVSHSITGKHLFENSTIKEPTFFPFLSRNKLISNQKQYLPNNRLTIQCDFYISLNNPESVVETFEYRKKDDLKMKIIPTSQILKENDLWKENIVDKLLKNGEFSDFVVSTPTQKFPVHRAILCTQSEVITAMLKHNMEEKNSNVVEIEGLEDDIVYEMLMYMYTNTHDALDVPKAQKLCYAADKFRIKTLQKFCFDYLMANLDVSNVTDILVLMADTYQDQELKSCISAFILEHVFDVINSEKWKNIKTTHSHLVLEIMQEIICKKLFDTKFAL